MAQRGKVGRSQRSIEVPKAGKVCEAVRECVSRFG